MKVFTSEKGLIKAWVDGVSFEEAARKQVIMTANLPFIHKHVAVMPDVHAGLGSTVGSVIPTIGAIIPAAVGVDIGCGMIAVRTSIKASDLPDSLASLRSEIEALIPVGFGMHQNDIHISRVLTEQYKTILSKYPKLAHDNLNKQMGTLGGGNHFVELCLDEENFLWIMLHSGSRGIGNKIGRYFIDRAKEEMDKYFIDLPDRDLAYLVDQTELFSDYIYSVNFAQQYAYENRQEMLHSVFKVLYKHFPDFRLTQQAINCHHNYISLEHHFDKNIYVTRKGAVRARKDEMGIIPGSMGAKSFIVMGLGNKESFTSCSHGAGRVMSRTQAKKEITLEDHIESTKGVECRKDVDVIDESPKAYKNIDDVMAAQKDLVQIMYTLKQILCIKG